MSGPEDKRTGEGWGAEPIVVTKDMEEAIALGIRIANGENITIPNSLLAGLTEDQIDYVFAKINESFPQE